MWAKIEKQKKKAKKENKKISWAKIENRNNAKIRKKAEKQKK